jgi:hypothetical protein
MKFFGLRNLSSQDVASCDPTTFVPKIVTYPSTKQEFRDWCGHPQTDHLFFTTVEGTIPGCRLTVQNPPHLMHGWVIDYDSKFIDGENIAQIPEVAPAGLCPMWTSRTFSGGARVVYGFERPILIDHKELTEKFLKLLAKELRVKDLLPGFDEASFHVHLQYFEAGRDWHPVKGGAPIKEEFLGLQVFNAATKAKLRGEDMEIPIEEVAAEVERQFPARWPGEFKVGARGPLFWINDGIDRVGCQVGDHGIIAYSERAGKDFLTWREVLGAEFVRNYQAERVGSAAQGIWFDGRHYWRKGEDDLWRRRTKEDMIMWLKGQGISARTHQKETASEAEKVLLTAQEAREVKAAAPIIHDKRECVIINGEKYLNISAVKVMQPAEHGEPQQFPWIDEFLTKVWDEAHPEQRDYFLAWFQHFYVHCLEGCPTQGQAAVISGLPSRGKTFFNHHILGRSLGGYSDATDFLMGHTNFNKSDSEVALWAIDDTRGGASWDNHAAFSAAIKKHVANPQVRCEGKGRDAVTMPWKGRIVVTCNTDKESLNIIPHLNATIADKLMLWKWGTWQAQFLPSGGSEAVVAKELPYFLAWLRDWTPPAYVLSDNPRYHVKSYHHPDMLRFAHEASPAARLSELLDIWRTESGQCAEADKPIWANPTKLRDILTANAPAREALREFSRNRMAAALESLGLKTRTNGNSTEYCIYEPA